MTTPVIISELLNVQRRAHHATLPVSATCREQRLQQMINLLFDHQDKFCQTLDDDFGGRNPHFSYMNDILSSIMSLEHARKSLQRWMKPSTRSTVPPFSWFGSRGRVCYYPKGVVGILGAWNVPLFTLFAPLSSTLAAGNRAILKPSELTPKTADLLAELVAEYIDPEVLTVVTGGPAIAAEFCTQKFDQIVFTGGTETGKKVMRAAAENLTPVILELGGKSPVIISTSADLDDAVKKIALGKGANSGQICISPDTIYVPEADMDSFCGKLADKYGEFHSEQSMTTSVINERHQQRIEAYIEEAEASHTEVIRSSYAVSDRRRNPLSIAINPPPDSQIRTQEIFGPALCVLSYQDLSWVIDDIRSRPNPLALYYFGNCEEEEQVLQDNILSGGMCTNDVMMHAAMNDAPFGGIGGSGMGAYHGKEGFAALSHARTQYRAGWWDPRKLVGMLPPYSDTFIKAIYSTGARFRRELL